MGEPYTKQLYGKLRELRFYLEREAVRITYWIASDRRNILLTVFRKSRMRDVREVERARHALARCIDEAHSAEGEVGQAMGERADWAALRERRMSEPGAAEAYGAARLAFELGREVRELRERRGWSQSELARASGMTQSAVARFEAGGTVPTLPVLERLAAALEVALSVKFEPRGAAA